MGESDSKTRLWGQEVHPRGRSCPEVLSGPCWPSGSGSWEGFPMDTCNLLSEWPVESEGTESPGAAVERGLEVSVECHLTSSSTWDWPKPSLVTLPTPDQNRMQTSPGTGFTAHDTASLLKASSTATGPCVPCGHRVRVCRGLCWEREASEALCIELCASAPSVTCLSWRPSARLCKAMLFWRWQRAQLTSSYDMLPLGRLPPRTHCSHCHTLQTPRKSWAGGPLF